VLFRLLTFHNPGDGHVALTDGARGFSSASWELAEIHTETSELWQCHLGPGSEAKQKSFGICSSDPNKDAFGDMKLMTAQTLTHEHAACGAGILPSPTGTGDDGQLPAVTASSPATLPAGTAPVQAADAPAARSPGQRKLRTRVSSWFVWFHVFFLRKPSRRVRLREANGTAGRLGHGRRKSGITDAGERRASPAAQFPATEKLQQVFVLSEGASSATIAVPRADGTLPSSLPQRNSAKSVVGGSEQTSALRVLKALIKKLRIKGPCVTHADVQMSSLHPVLP